MKIIKLLTIFLLIVSCTEKQYVFYNAIQGRVVSVDNQPIMGAKIYVDTFASNAFRTSNDFRIETDNDGKFFANGKMLPYKYLRKQLRIDHNFHIEKEGYIKKIIYIENLKGTGEKLDTIDVGTIFLEKLKK